jgi:hypothetical protein
VTTILTQGDYMKEDLRRLWSQTNQKTADSFLNDWTARAKYLKFRTLK